MKFTAASSTALFLAFANVLTVSAAEQQQRRELLSLSIVGNGGNPASAFPLGLCQGDCDNDDECEGTLRCFQRNEYVPVTGCDGEGLASMDYCYDPEGLPRAKLVGENGIPADVFPLQECQGDCGELFLPLYIFFVWCFSSLISYFICYDSFQMTTTTAPVI